MKMKKCMSLVMAVILLVCLFMVGTVSASAESSKIRPDLAERLQKMEDSEMVPVIVSIYKYYDYEGCVTIEEFVAKKYGLDSMNADNVNEYIYYCRLEHDNMVYPQTLNFINDYKEGIGKIINNYLLILEVDKKTIYKMAEDDRVAQISYNENLSLKNFDVCEVGDATCDGKFDMKDILVTRKYMIGFQSSTLFIKAAADMNGDGNIDMKDVFEMRLRLAPDTAEVSF